MKLNIPFTPTLKLSSVSESIKLALDIFINNSKIEVISNDKLNQVFYAINEAKRAEVLYHKNMILHHFLVPVFINLAWYNILNNKISSEKELLLFLNNKRKELKYEFYLPTIKEMFFEARDIVMLAIGKEIQGFSDILNFNQEELLKIGETTKRFSSILSYIYEAYFISAVTLKYLSQEEIKIEKFLEISRELFLIELEHGRVVKYTESYSVPLLKNTLSFFINQKAIEYNEETKVYSVSNLDRVNYYIEKFANDLNDQMSINLKFSTSTSISPR